MIPLLERKICHHLVQKMMKDSTNIRAFSCHEYFDMHSNTIALGFGAKLPGKESIFKFKCPTSQLHTEKYAEPITPMAYCCLLFTDPDDKPFRMCCVAPALDPGFLRDMLFGTSLRAIKATDYI